MPLSWNEIKDRAIKFSMEWEDETSEHAESQSFWNDFFNIFGISRRRVATFEKRVRKLGDSEGNIDLFWKGTILIEHKSKGKDLNKAYKQAADYFHGLTEDELPKYILVSDFARFRLYNLEENSQHEFLLKDLVSNVQHFGFIAGYQKRTYKEEDPVNIEAAELMGKLHDKLKDVGYGGHNLELHLVRMLYCLFADDTSIFEKGLFEDFVELKSREDGSNLASQLAHLFQILDTPKNKRLKNLDDTLNTFPYVNGRLFEEKLPLASFDKKMRSILLDCCKLDWGKISPAIFGSLFQSVMNSDERRDLGAHYTSEKNILKVIKPLFLDSLWEEFEKVKSTKNKLLQFHAKISSLKFLDPACGCGNFLVITYRELRLLEIKVIKASQKGQMVTNINHLIRIDIENFFGIEYEEFPVRIAEVAMWLIDHQMNMKVSGEFGEYYVRLPLDKAASITHGNALRINWNEIVPAHELSYILGNPPYSGKKEQNAEQKEDMSEIFKGVKGAGILDYVSAWYIKAAALIQGTNIRVAYVSTNSISQGEQVGILWCELFATYKVKIHFAHRTFKWSNEAKGKAAVHVVIIGFAYNDILNKYLYEYNAPTSEPHERKVTNINPYLVEGKDTIVLKRSRPLSPVAKINYGSIAIDNGNLIMSDEEMKDIIEKEPEASKYIRRFTGGVEFLNRIDRWCLWLVDIQPSVLRRLKYVSKRVQKVKEFRSGSGRAQTNKLADCPALFGEIRQPDTDYILIPKVSSETRKYIPIGFMSKDIIASGSCLVVPRASMYHFGVLMSEMHMAWVKYVGGRMKSDYQYSSIIIYNNFPWPIKPGKQNIEKVERIAHNVLSIGEEYSDSSLADLYDPVSMPPKLVKAHQALDKAVDLCYRPQAFVDEVRRIEYLFELYEQYTNPLLKGVNKKGNRGRRKSSI